MGVMKGLLQIATIPVMLSIVSVVMLQSIYPSGVASQLFFLFAGTMLFYYSSRLPFSFWKSFAKFFYVIVIALLFFTLVIGKTTKGSSRWLVLGPIHIQPSQLAVPAVALSLAIFAKKNSMKKPQNILKFAGLATLPTALIFVQPDLGTATVFGVISGIIYFFSGVSWKNIGVSVLLVLLLLTIGWNFILHDYQRNRIFSYLQPEEETLSIAYNAEQSKIAVGSGKLLGRGFGHGVLSALRFLPERQTDFFFASFAEEFGFVGSFALLILYLGFFLQLLLLIFQPSDVVVRLYGVATLGMFIWQTSVNLGMNIGLLPITGITLPFLSYGGSSVISLFLSLAILQSGANSKKKERFIEFRGFV